MTQHTPGPWEASDTGLVFGQVSGDSDEAPFVADCCNDGASGEYTEQEQANARLIAAAPDGLAANKMALAYIADELTETSRDEDPDAWAIVDALSAAIAKATGSP